MDDDPGKQLLRSIEHARVSKRVKESTNIDRVSNALRNWLQTLKKMCVTVNSKKEYVKYDGQPE